MCSFMVACGVHAFFFWSCLLHRVCLLLSLLLIHRATGDTTKKRHAPGREEGAAAVVGRVGMTSTRSPYHVVSLTSSLTSLVWCWWWWTSNRRCLHRERMDMCVVMMIPWCGLGGSASGATILGRNYREKSVILIIDAVYGSEVSPFRIRWDTKPGGRRKGHLMV